MSIKAIGAESPDWTLDQLAAFIWGNEIVWGQASQIGNDGATTVVIFDSTHTPPIIDDAVHVDVILAGTPQPQAAKALLCSGKAFVGGAPQRVQVFRI